MIRRPPRSTQGVSSAASDVYKRQASRIKGQSSVPEFTYAGQSSEVSAISKGEPTGDPINWGLIIAVSVLGILSLVALAYFTGFIGIEFDEEHEYDKSGDDYNKAPSKIPEDFREEEEKSTLERYEDHPGWLWDASSEEWVPDPDFQG